MLKANSLVAAWHLIRMHAKKRRRRSTRSQASFFLSFFSFSLSFFFPTRHGWIGRRRPIDVIAWLAARLKWPIGRHGRPLLAVLITYVSTWTTRPCGSHRIFSHTSAVVFLLAATVQPSSSIKTIVSGSSMEVFKLRDWRRNRDRGIVRGQVYWISSSRVAIKYMYIFLEEF